MPKTYSGFTDKTPEHLLLDAGAFFKNFIVATDTFETAVTAGKLIGATRGGGEFKAVPTIRPMPIDGVKGRAKGLQTIDEWDVSLMSNVLEITKDSLMAALAAAKVDTETSLDYDIIEGKQTIELSDYIDNITWVGRLSGSAKPVIIQVFNAFNGDGLTLGVNDKGEAVSKMTFLGHYDASALDSPPFKIYYPKPVA